jgi:hypothetical protein
MSEDSQKGVSLAPHERVRLLKWAKSAQMFEEFLHQEANGQQFPYFRITGDRRPASSMGNRAARAEQRSPDKNSDAFLSKHRD